MPDGSRLGLRIADLTLSFLDKAPAELPLDGRAEAEVRAWLAGQMAVRGPKADKLDAALPYDMPHHVLALGARYSLEELLPAFGVLSVWYANGYGMLDHVRGKLAAKKLMAPMVRCWPHHFDYDCLVSFGGDRGMGVGFSPGDEYCDEPYYYVTIYPEPSIPGLPLLPALGHWHTYKFLAALAPAHKIVAATSPVAYSENFFEVAIGAALKAQK